MPSEMEQEGLPPPLEETPEEKKNREERLLEYCESEIQWDSDRNVNYKRMSPEGITAALAWLMTKSVRRQEGVLAATSACIHRQEEINKAIKSDACWTKWLTLGVFILTAAVVALTVALLVKG
jgi:hypothetical protein